MAGFYLPKHMLRKPKWVGEVPKKGRRILVYKGADGSQEEVDLGPSKASRRPYFVIPGMGEMEREEMEDLVTAMRERPQRQRERPDINAIFRELITRKLEEQRMQARGAQQFFGKGRGR